MGGSTGSPSWVLSFSLFPVWSGRPLFLISGWSVLRDCSDCFLFPTRGHCNVRVMLLRAGPKAASGPGGFCSFQLRFNPMKQEAAGLFVFTSLSVTDSPSVLLSQRPCVDGGSRMGSPDSLRGRRISSSNVSITFLRRRTLAWQVVA